MDIRLLAGAVEYRGPEGLVRIPGTSARAVLAMLALRPGQVLLTDEIIDGLWGRRFPHDPTAAVQVTVSRLRHVMGEERHRLRTVPLGYQLDAGAEEIDVGRVEAALRRGRSLIQRGAVAEAEALLTSALLLCHHGSPLVEFADLPLGPPAASRLLALRCDLVEVCNAASLATGRPHEVPNRTTEILRLDPWRESLVAQLMRALHQTGRTAEAIAAYSSFAATLQSDLAVEPSSELRELHARITAPEPGAGPHHTIDLRDEARPRWFEAALEELDREEDDAVLRARLQLALGQAEQQGGLPGWQETLRRARDTARTAGDVNLEARCVLASAPGWTTTPGAPDNPRLFQLTELLEGDDLNDDMRARLIAAYANELCFTSSLDERLALTDQAMAIARRSGNPTTVLAVLNQRFNAIWAPETHDIRLAESTLACELAESSGHLPVQIIAHGFAMAAAVEAADITAIDEHLTQFEVLAHRLRLPVFEWGVVVHTGWRAVLAGELDQAEELAERALAFGHRAARPEAEIVHTSQLAAVRWAQGRLGEILPALESLAHSLPVFQALSAEGHLQAGDARTAKALLTETWRSGAVRALHHDQLYTTALVHWAEVAAATSSLGPAEELYSSLLPYAHTLAFTGTDVHGPVALHLAPLAAALGESDVAQDNLARATAISAALRARPRDPASGLAAGV